MGSNDLQGVLGCLDQLNDCKRGVDKDKFIQCGWHRRQQINVQLLFLSASRSQRAKTLEASSALSSLCPTSRCLTGEANPVRCCMLLSPKHGGGGSKA